MKILLVHLIALSMAASAGGQNLVGYSPKNIKNYMKENYPGHSLQTGVVNEAYKYLKYVDDEEVETLIFFLNERDICNAVKIICDNSLKSSKITDLDNRYTRTGISFWREERKGKKYVIELVNDQWFFTINIKEDIKK